MKKYLSFIMKLRYLTIVLVLITILTYPAQAQGDGPRFYWKGLNGTNAVPVIGSSLGGNASPSDPSHTVIPGATFEATMSMAGYAKIIHIKKRSALVSVLFPMGRISSNITVDGLTNTTSTRGFGDPMLQFSMNVIGPKAIMNIPDVLRYKPGLSVDVMGSLALPIGQYDNTSPLNMGQNRWYGRIGAPVIWQIGPWVPGKRTTFEFLPAMWLFGNNTDFLEGRTMETKPMYQLEFHITRDFMERLWGSLDVISYSGGKATVEGVEGNALNNVGMGGTMGYKINDNMQLNISYSTIVNDKNAEDLKMDGFRVTLIYGWHELIEGMRRLNGEK